MFADRDMGVVFEALGNERRRRMLDIVTQAPGIRVGDVARQFDVSRIAVMKHLAVLEAANLLVSEKYGRARRLYVNTVPIRMIHDRWTSEFSAYWSGQVAEIKYRAELRDPKQKQKGRSQ